MSRSASAICTMFAETAALLPATARVHLTGFPVPAGIAGLASAATSRPCAAEACQHRLLVLGGSGGALTLNRTLPAALGRMRHCLDGWHIVHQTGPGQLQAVEERYQAAGIDALAVSFIDELAHVLAQTDLVVCRAGGGTLAELAVAGVPALLLPHPESSDDHQLANAQVYATAGASRFLDERACQARLEETLAAELEWLLVEDHVRADMAAAIREFSRPEAAWDIARLCAQLLAVGTETAAAA
jgi:UDP-N-acetylglucosamine--N-acetylmuramyl-(pentapeptide) pyrophosphoryl-undecaprenol N-acetylglucosamine transferase